MKLAALLAFGVLAVVGASAATPQWDSVAPTAPTRLAAVSAWQRSIELSWRAASDNVRVTGYVVSLDGMRVSRVSHTSYRYSRLSCGTAYVLGVAAYDRAGNTSGTATVTAPTSPCPGETTGGSTGTVSPPENTAAPVVSGTPLVGKAVELSTGSWTGRSIAYTFRWRRCDSSGSQCSTIGRVATSTYVLTGADEGSTVRGVVTASNPGGSAEAVSAASRLVVAPTPTPAPTPTTPTPTTPTPTTPTPTTPTPTTPTPTTPTPTTPTPTTPTPTTPTPTTPTPTTPTPTTPSAGSSYDVTVLADQPVGFWAMSAPGSAEPDLSGRGRPGAYRGGTPATVALPNGDRAADFNGSGQYMTVASSASFSIPTTGQLTWEAWIRPDTLQFPSRSPDGYVDFMGKCADYSPSCEWESRMYSSSTPEGRCNRISAYVFKPSAGLGSGADWQPTCGLIEQGSWLHVVGEYQTITTPSACSGAYPGTIAIWVNGVPWSFAAHAPTGCMSQYSVKPVANSSPVNVGAMAMEYWFSGAVGKVAIYDRLLGQSQIAAHYAAMTGKQPSGSCAATCTLG